MDAQKLCIISFVVYIVALILFLAGFGGSYWLYVSGSSLMQTRQGLWEYCLKPAGGSWTCSSLDVTNQDAWFQATAAFMIMALIVAIAAGVSRMYMPVSCVLEITAGAFTMIAITVYGAEADNANVSKYLDWSFGLAAAAGVMFVINGIILAVFNYRAGCDMTRRLPCES